MNGPRVIDLGRMAYRPACEQQSAHHAEVLAAREARRAEPGRLLFVEHDPVITVTPRPGVASHLVASPEALARAGISVEPTDRGGDITYHGPGQVVCYPILDLDRLGLRLHGYMRLLERAVIDACAEFGVPAVRDPGATGVWTAAGPDAALGAGGLAKLCAMGVRIRRWATLHGLALNVRPRMDHFAMIVPCGLAGRPVTSLDRVLGEACPGMDEVKAVLAGRLSGLINDLPGRTGDGEGSESPSAGAAGEHGG